MSFRYYPLYIKGNPQLRVFLPNFWMKLVKPDKPIPSNQVHFIVPLEMTHYDVKNYLEKIYKVPVTQVVTKIITGDIKKSTRGYLIKDPDYKMAYVSLPDDMKFEFPNLYPQDKKEKQKEEEKHLTDQVKGLMKQRRKGWDRADVPSWFGI